MRLGIVFPPIKIYENVICDGHHRYVASILAEVKIECIPTVISSATTIIEWENIDFLEEDWDTPAKIRMLNEQDADFNNIPLLRLNELLK